MAVAHAIQVIIYHMLKNGIRYQDLGPGYFDKLNERATRATVSRAVARLEILGHEVSPWRSSGGFSKEE